MAGPATLYQEGDHASRPANGAGCVLYACTDHELVYRDDGSSWTTWATLGAAAGDSTIAIVIDGGGAEIATGIVADLVVDFACTIESVTLLADQTGSIVVDIWKDTYANFPPTDADSITASAVPTISSATKSQDATLTGWTTSISAGDLLRFNVDSVTDIELVTLALKVSR